MSTTRTPASEQSLGEALGYGELPPLSAADRVAIRIGLALILRAQRHAEAAERAEHARRSCAAAFAEQSRDTAFEHRSHAGPTW